MIPNTIQPKNAAGEPEAATRSIWHLQMPGGTVFGPCPLDTLVAWAEQGRVEPGSKVSPDGRSWRPAEDIAALGLEWMIELDGSRIVGPFHLHAIREFLDDGSVSPSTALQNRRTGERTTVAAKRSLVADTPESTKATLDLQTARAELREANARMQVAENELRTTNGRLQGKQAELRASAEELQGARAELQTARSELRTAHAELNAAKVLLSTWKPEMESLRAECERLRAALATERTARQEASRGAAEAATAHQATLRSIEEQTRRREAKFKQEFAVMEARIATIAAQADQKEDELTAAHGEVEELRKQVDDASARVADRDAAIASLRETVERERIEREQQDTVYRREQAEGAVFRIAASRRETELKAQIATQNRELSLIAAEREAARHAEEAAKERAAEIETALRDTRLQTARELELARNDLATLERERVSLGDQLDATKSELRVGKENLLALGKRVSEIERDRDRLANAMDAANADLKSMRTRFGEMTAALAEATAHRDAARQAEAALSAAISQRDAAIAAAKTEAAATAEATARKQESSHRNRADEAERLQSVVRQKESEIADLDRLAKEYQLQIRALADRCAKLESVAAVHGDPAQATSTRGNRRGPMKASNWTFADSEEPSSSAPDHPLAGLEARAAQELLNWRRSKDGGQK